MINLGSLVICLSGLLITVITSCGVFHLSDQSLQHRLEGVTRDISNQFSVELEYQLRETYVATLIQMGQINLTRSNFEDITAATLSLTRESTTTAYAPMVTAEQRPAFEESQQRVYYPVITTPFEITQIVALPEVTRRDEDARVMFPYTLINPLLPTVLGLDMFVLWESTILEIVETHKPALSPALRFMEDLSYVPVFVDELGIPIEGMTQTATIMILYPVVSNGSVSGIVSKDFRVRGSIDAIVRSVENPLDCFNLFVYETTIGESDDEKPKLIHDQLHPSEILERDGASLEDVSSVCRLFHKVTVRINNKELVFVTTTCSVPAWYHYATPALFLVAFTAIVLVMYNRTLLTSNENLVLAEKYKSATEVKSKFLAQMSHELRTPLNGVIGMSEALLDITSGNAKEYVGVIVSCGNILMRVIGDILDFSKIESNSMFLESTLNDPSVHVLDVLYTLLSSYKKPPSATTVNLAYEVDDSIPTCKIYTDFGKIQHVILNLCSNAFKFTDSGTIRVCVSSSPFFDGKTPDYLRGDTMSTYVELKYTVADTGIGMNVAQMKKLFEPFSQVHAGRNAGGTGLGLAICRSMCESMGGTISCTSRPNHTDTEESGSTFTATFIARCEGCASGTKKPIRNAWKLGSHFFVEKTLVEYKDKRFREYLERSEIEEGPMVQPSALVADDSNINVRIMKMALGKIGVKCYSVLNGEEAVSSCDNMRFSVLIFDFHMPVMTGIEAIQKIREGNSINRNTPGVCVTASTTKEDKIVALQAGMQESLSKPIERSKLYLSLVPFLTVENLRWVKHHYR